MTAIVFPGQGSQRPGMGHDLHARYPAARDVFAAVSDATGTDMAGLCFHSDEATLRRTENAQLALFTCGMAAWRCMREELGEEPAAFAGHSVGEFAAVCASGAIGLEPMARLVQHRGAAMAAAGREAPGTMAAVLGMAAPDLEALCQEVAEHGVCVIANDNAPGQLVVSGGVDAIHAVSALAAERGAKRVLPINVSGAFHSPLMAGPARDFQARLDAAEFSGTMHTPVYANVTATPVRDPSQWPQLLGRQLVSQVRWTESVRAMGGDGVGLFVECGAGEVLCGLVRRILPDAEVDKVVDSATLEAAVGRIQGAVA
jgi:[acyl-carrier-protein] S-malonyltransferase